MLSLLIYPALTTQYILKNNLEVLNTFFPRAPKCPHQLFPMACLVACMALKVLMNLHGAEYILDILEPIFLHLSLNQATKHTHVLYSDTSLHQNDLDELN